MIDFSKFSTTEEKLIAQHFEVVNRPLSQKQIRIELDLKERWVRETLKNLLQSGFLASYKNEFGITLYKPVVSAGQPVVNSGTTLTLVNQTKPNLTNEISKEISTTACAVDELVLPVGRLGGGAAVL
ncbi:MAG: hypothetical protein LBT89_07585, partial [Planctomycetaceae bacterium]|nr:hypothetical protein [Planctomycetaceae bacterium]